MIDADEGISKEGVFPEPQRPRAEPESGVSLGSPCLGGTSVVWDAAGSDAGQQLCVPLLLQGLLRGEVLAHKIKETEVFACLTSTRQ